MDGVDGLVVVVAAFPGVVDDEWVGGVVLAVLPPDEPDDVLGWPLWPDVQPVRTTGTMKSVSTQIKILSIRRRIT